MSCFSPIQLLCSENPGTAPNCTIMHCSLIIIIIFADHDFIVLFIALLHTTEHPVLDICRNHDIALSLLPG